jgi:hypothetical protein
VTAGPHGVVAQLQPLLSRWLATALHACHGGTAALSRGLGLIAKHTGVPVVLVAALALVISFRLARKAARLAVELTVALGFVIAATRLGWIRW